MVATFFWVFKAYTTFQYFENGSIFIMSAYWCMILIKESCPSIQHTLTLCQNDDMYHFATWYIHHYSFLSRNSYGIPKVLPSEFCNNSDDNILSRMLYAGGKKKICISELYCHYQKWCSWLAHSYYGSLTRSPIALGQTVSLPVILSDL